MSKRTSKAATALAAANAADGIPEQVAAPAAILAPAAPSTPQSKRGKSLVESPVARVWYNCINAVAAAKNAGTALPGRKALHEINMADGIAYYTSRTQVQAYLKASGNGARIPVKLPKGLVIN
jgi:hypothetical protein